MSAPYPAQQPALLIKMPYPPPAPSLALPLRDSPQYRVINRANGCNAVELLTVLLGGPRAEATARALLDKYGSVNGLARASTLELIQSVAGISEKLAARLKAALELGQRIQTETGMEQPIISSPADAAALLLPRLCLLEQEYLYVLLLNVRNRVIGEPVEVYHGSVNMSLIRIGEVFRDAVRVNATSIIVAHNHPSGDPSPSPEDVVVTKALIEAGKQLDIEVVDHLICGGQKFVSLKERGLGFGK